MGDDSLMNGYWGRQRRKGRHEVLGVACLCLAGFCRFVTSQEGREVSTQNIPHVSRDSVPIFVDMTPRFHAPGLPWSGPGRVRVRVRVEASEEWRGSNNRIRYYCTVGILGACQRREKIRSTRGVRKQRKPGHQG